MFWLPKIVAQQIKIRQKLIKTSKDKTVATEMADN